MNEVPPIRRLVLVPEPSEPRLGGADAIRRYRLGRLEEVAEASRVHESPPSSNGGEPTGAPDDPR